MTTYYCDSSALVKRYVTETGSPWLRSLCQADAGHVLALANIALVEIAAALAVKYRQGVLPSVVRDGLLRDLERDGREQYFLLDVNQEIVLQAVNLTRRQKLRGYDAVHLACALFLRDTLNARALPAPVLIAADTELLIAAQAEGLATENPNLH